MHLYRHHQVHRMTVKAQKVVKDLFAAFAATPALAQKSGGTLRMYYPDGAPSASIRRPSIASSSGASLDLLTLNVALLRTVSASKRVDPRGLTTGGAR